MSDNKSDKAVKVVKVKVAEELYEAEVSAQVAGRVSCGEHPGVGISKIIGDGPRKANKRFFVSGPKELVEKLAKG